MPPQNGVGSDNGGYISEKPPTESRTDTGQAPPVIVGQLQPSVPQLRLEDPVLLTQICDRLRLPALEPTQNGRDDQLCRNHERSLREVDRIFGHYGSVAWTNRGVLAI